jgi:hypothetical protein
MKEGILGHLGSDGVLPQQFFDTFRRSQRLEPEKALLLAILEDAIHGYQKYVWARDAADKERFQEAESWIMRSGDDWIFSFENVCELLGLDPEYLRRGLLEWREQNGAQSKR